MTGSSNIHRVLRDVTTRLQHPVGRLGLACALAVLLGVNGFAPHPDHAHAPYALAADNEASNQSLYAAIFSAQEKGDFSHASRLMAQLSDTRLVGYVLAQRYTNAQYKPSATELADWLKLYHDHPQAQEIAALAKKAGVPSQVVALADAPSPLAGAGYAAQMGRDSMPDVWYHGLQLWRSENYVKAASSFEEVAKNEGLSDWHRATGAYWAYRSYSKLGQNQEAAQALAQAAKYPETLYGMIANAQSGESLRVTASMPEVSPEMWKQPAVQRAQYLSALERDGEAEAELRQLYVTLPERDQTAMVSVAAKLNLPNLQLRFARSADLTNAQALAAHYPMPKPMLDAQHNVDPALLLAVAMHESGFRESVRSGGGALGMMQMLPSTAKHVAHISSGLEMASATPLADDTLSIHDRLNDMAMSTRLGATYFTMLAHEPAVGNNMIRLLAAYNAGPGTVKNWQKTAAKNMDDPLLYLESIPYPETHNYVSQVLAHYWMYQALMNEPTPALKQLANGTWPVLRKPNA